MSTELEAMFVLEPSPVARAATQQVFQQQRDHALQLGRAAFMLHCCTLEILVFTREVQLRARCDKNGGHNYAPLDMFNP